MPPGAGTDPGADADNAPPRWPRLPRGTERLASAADRARYRELAALIDRNRHPERWSTWAVTTETIRVVRKSISEGDIPILIAMLSDKEHGAAAQSLLTTQGMKAVPALLAVRPDDYYAAGNADAALRAIRNCYSVELWDRMNPDECPADRAAHRGETVPELPLLR